VCGAMVLWEVWERDGGMAGGLRCMWLYARAAVPCGENVLGAMGCGLADVGGQL
jgi:hypothetical protein